MRRYLGRDRTRVSPTRRARRSARSAPWTDRGVPGRTAGRSRKARRIAWNRTRTFSIRGWQGDKPFRLSEMAGVSGVPGLNDRQRRSGPDHHQRVLLALAQPRRDANLPDRQGLRGDPGQGFHRRPASSGPCAVCRGADRVLAGPARRRGCCISAGSAIRAGATGRGPKVERPATTGSISSD